MVKKKKKKKRCSKNNDRWDRYEKVTVKGLVLGGMLLSKLLIRVIFGVMKLCWQ